MNLLNSFLLLITALSSSISVLCASITSENNDQNHYSNNSTLSTKNESRNTSLTVPIAYESCFKSYCKPSKSLFNKTLACSILFNGPLATFNDTTLMCYFTCKAVLYAGLFRREAARFYCTWAYGLEWNYKFFKIRNYRALPASDKDDRLLLEDADLGYIVEEPEDEDDNIIVVQRDVDVDVDVDADDKGYETPVCQDVPHPVVIKQYQNYLNVKRFSH